MITEKGVTDGGVSIHASAREATYIQAKTDVIAEFQSTPPRGRRLDIQDRLMASEIVSIHASAREATFPTGHC